MHEIELIGTPDRKGRPTAFTFTFPSSWEECTAEQLGDMAILSALGLEPAHLKMRALQKLAAIPAKQFDKMKLVDMIQAVDEDGTLVFMPQLNWLLEAPIYGKSRVPTIEVGGVTYQGPRDTLGNFTLLQFSFADHCLAALAGNPTDDALDMLLGTLYYPLGTAWDNAGIEARARKLSAVPGRIKLAATLNYRSLRACVVQLYPLTFKGGDSDGFGIDGLLEGYAGDKFGTVDQVGAMPLHPALVHSERAIKRKEELEAEIAAMKRKS